ncbi:uncharacterized protein BT62DRAFT_929177 [Guyanagaster necrorhizus]|uniref:Uncharacterized protein n=1 Tax=Guyanagaster necrorhizus TaxID=856835 RepID=A0A9P8AWS0_9AGAR|nr:uncharacterized protein BT62DRAFT_929177 [Guyanagaster necrorhizus MCA 3950]KAG7449197.1 hypothetical protein BT62DRAFT_929177 [Guyanagaster necrorhizus MCA 3950]
MSTSYLPHVLYSMAIMSLSVHLVYQKHSMRQEKGRVTGQISILEDVITQLRSGTHLSRTELQRLRKLAMPSSKEEKEEITWKEALLGKKDIKTSSRTDDNSTKP